MRASTRFERSIGEIVRENPNADYDGAYEAVQASRDGAAKALSAVAGIALLLYGPWVAIAVFLGGPMVLSARQVATEMNGPRRDRRVVVRAVRASRAPSLT
jgi:hypothetical protein